MRYIFILFTGICFSLSATNPNELQNAQNNQELQNNVSLRLPDILDGESYIHELRMTLGLTPEGEQAIHAIANAASVNLQLRDRRLIRRERERERHRQRREQQQMHQAELSGQDVMASLPEESEEVLSGFVESIQMIETAPEQPDVATHNNLTEAIARLQATSDAIHAQNQSNNQGSR